MIARILLAALGAGLVAGLLITPVQYARVVPLILHAEAFEGGRAALEVLAEAETSVADGSFDGARASAGPPGEGAEAGPETSGESRLLGTLSANLLTGAGMALILAAASLILAVPVTGANGARWGLVGFAVLSLAPAIGLAPELPAMPAADLAARQGWWSASVLLAAAGAYALILRRELWAKALGLLAIALPHLLGAPRPEILASPVPPTLAAEFAVASLATAAAFWLILGQVSGYAFDRMRRDPPRARAC